VGHHRRGLRREWSKRNVSPDEQEDLLGQLKNRPTEIATSDADRAMLAYAVKLTMTPAWIARDDVERLAEQGFGEQAIHDICAITAYFAFANRIADGLGVEIEEKP